MDTEPRNFSRDPAWAVRIFDWLSYGSVWRKVWVAFLLSVLFTLLSMMISSLAHTLEWNYWIQLSAQATLMFAFVLLLFFLSILGLLRIIRHNILRHISGPDALRKLTASDLEHLTAAVYEAQGCKIKRRGIPGLPDKGIDLEIFRNGKRGVIQCKKWTHENVGVEKLRELHGAMVDANAEFAIFITTSNFTEPAEEYAYGKPIELVSFGMLWEMVAEAKLQGDLNNLVATPKLEVKDREPLQCPKCGNSLVLRKSKHGPFLGCRSFHETGCGTLIPLKEK